ncbi:class I SAM-dependent methyltransferase [Subsaximicrobium wynnwilliamsii]|nr:methyltransferase domain-containing protein [Subsaximicrobium wynnwilliamsii]
MKMLQRVKNFKNFIIVLLPLIVLQLSCAQDAKPSEAYVFKNGNPNGIGKWYMGREIAHVMGFQGIDWLERTARETEENTSKLINNMNIKTGDTIADIGAGSGFHVFKMAPLAKNGLVYAVDIQEQMLKAMEARIYRDDVKNVSLIMGNEKSVNLPENSVDKLLMVDVYHEFNDPKEMMASIEKALRADGKIYLIEYRAEDSAVPIKKVHKMSEAQAVKEFEAAGFVLEENMDNLPWQHCMVFVKKR